MSGRARAQTTDVAKNTAEAPSLPKENQAWQFIVRLGIFRMDDDDRDSNASSENDQDEVMEDVDDADGDMEPEEDDNEDDQEDGDREETADDAQDKGNEEASGDQRDGSRANSASARSPKGKSPQPISTLFPTVRPEAVNARLYDIVPTMAAPQATSINAIAITPDLRYWMTGGSDGYIRKYDGPGTINGKQLLTVAQRHPFVDSVVKAGILMSYWENEEPGPPNPRGNEEHVLSPVYSLAVHSQALWLLSGLESGGINLQSVRHDEGKRITCLQQHTNAVSVLSLAQDEKSVLSGSWDKNIFDWDLNTGTVKRSFDGSGGQISAIELRPVNGAPIPADAMEEDIKFDTTFSSNNGKPVQNGTSGGVNGADSQIPNPSGGVEGQASPAHESLFGGSDTGSLFGDNVGGNYGGDDDDEFSRAMGDMGMPTLHDGSGQDGGMDHSADIDMTNAFSADTTSAPAVQPPETSSPEASRNQVQAQTADSSAVDAQLMQDVANAEAQPASNFGDAAAAPDGQPSEPAPGSPSLIFASDPPAPAMDPTQTADTIFFSAAIDGPIRLWDRRVQDPVARIGNQRGVPPWCMGACWSPDGNWIYAGRRNGTVEEYSIHKARSGWAPERTLKFPTGSGAVSAVRAMPNGRHLVCASHDIMRLYDLKDTRAFKHSTVPFLIIPGPPRAGVISSLYIDRTCRFMLSAAGTRGWEGTSTEVLIGYEINVTADK
ncbi:transcription factor spt8 [Colletotrichum karsti]|uniref:Transcription factor spt8 n=1 Tax=Colletotrichum karsti TaxID=1095194 RepID=A0A9P6HXW8_9PEZI|nr:transcription factor spt8 [Colletotrichum karsti]KAF9872165.1 transcription factor spt8 [Colletotrichum karsti]